MFFSHVFLFHPEIDSELFQPTYNLELSSTQDGSIATTWMNILFLFVTIASWIRDRAPEGTPKNNPSAPGELRLGAGVHAAPELPQRTAAVGEADLIFFSQVMTPNLFQGEKNPWDIPHIFHL